MDQYNVGRLVSIGKNERISNSHWAPRAYVLVFDTGTVLVLVFPSIRPRFNLPNRPILRSTSSSALFGENCHFIYLFELSIKAVTATLFPQSLALLWPVFKTTMASAIVDFKRHFRCETIHFWVIDLHSVVKVSKDWWKTVCTQPVTIWISWFQNDVMVVNAGYH